MIKYSSNHTMKNRFTCIVSIGENQLHHGEYKTLKEIAEDLQLTYQQVADISVGRFRQSDNNKFKYQPIIKIEKLSIPIV